MLLLSLVLLRGVGEMAVVASFVVAAVVAVVVVAVAVVASVVLVAAVSAMVLLLLYVVDFVNQLKPKIFPFIEELQHKRNIKYNSLYKHLGDEPCVQGYKIVLTYFFTASDKYFIRPVLFNLFELEAQYWF